eukprot:TRINITY_DN23678_c0_g1_i1.p3 TRINITY_DN23678_c0_g1~~TRINITY_DN23678_c0_g1_i1.p3  ORF type:complete len:102 (-),score=6.69 TRINITY_DN23678_c0_g1_i1:258-563(-)
MIRRPPRSTHCISSAASDVYKRQLIYRVKHPGVRQIINFVQFLTCKRFCRRILHQINSIMFLQYYLSSKRVLFQISYFKGLGKFLLIFLYLQKAWHFNIIS